MQRSPLRHRSAPERPVHHLTWVDGRTLVVVDSDGRVDVTDSADGTVLATATTRRSITAVAADSAAGWLAWGDDGGTVELRSSGGRRDTCAFREPVDALEWTNNRTVPLPHLAVAAGHDVAVVVPGTGIVTEDRFRSTSATCVAWVRPGLTAVGGNGGTRFLTTDGSLPTTPDGGDLLPDLPSPGAVTCVDVDLEGHRLTVGDLRGEVRITSLQTGEELSLDGLGDRVQSCRWWHEASLLGVAVDDEVTVWEAAPFDLEPEPVRTIELDGLAAPVTPSPDREVLALADIGGFVHVLTAETLTMDRPVVFDSRPRCLAWSPDGVVLAVGTDDGVHLIER